jgi:ABC-type nickel/cobalt efflux system permease component RcnA
VRNLAITLEGAVVAPKIEAVKLTLDTGAGGMPVMRISTDLRIAGRGGRLRYEDRNYPSRAGWKEVVVQAGRGTEVMHASPAGKDRSAGLTAYPQDPAAVPPQELTAEVEWRVLPQSVPSQPWTPVLSPRPAPAPPASTPPVFAPLAAPPQSQPAGTVVRGDFLSQLLRKGEIGWQMGLLGVLVAFGLGAMHALSPGHGKTTVAAYLVGSRGTVRHAMFLGGMVTFTHTISVFFLGIATLFLSEYVLPEKIFPVLGAISGFSIVCIGGHLLYKRARQFRGVSVLHHHHHHHDHGHIHPHTHGHSHTPEGQITLGNLIALGVSGGLVPCPSALILLLSAVAIGRPGLGLVLLVGFSAGLAVVLMAIGTTVLYAKRLLPQNGKIMNSRAFRLAPVLSAAFIVCVGIVMTAVALGIIQPGFRG